VVPEKVRHFNIPPAGPEPFYVSTGSEPQPRPVGDEMGTVIYDYQPKLCVDYVMRTIILLTNPNIDFQRFI